ncbi:MAG TPA: hypothetical protein VGD08_00850 [Stellaceae bacterium]|jgi:hypothetical protein
MLARFSGMEWTVRKAKVGTATDTPTSLRLKAAEFLRMAGETQFPDMADELRTLCQRYLERAAEMEAAQVAPIKSEIEPGKLLD